MDPQRRVRRTLRFRGRRVVADCRVRRVLTPLEEMAWLCQMCLPRQLPLLNQISNHLSNSPIPLPVPRPPLALPLPLLLLLLLHNYHNHRQTLLLPLLLLRICATLIQTSTNTARFPPGGNDVLIHSAVPITLTTTLARPHGTDPPPAPLQTPTHKITRQMPLETSILAVSSQTTCWRLAIHLIVQQPPRQPHQLLLRFPPGVLQLQVPAHYLMAGRNDTHPKGVPIMLTTTHGRLRGSIPDDKQSFVSWDQMDRDPYNLRPSHSWDLCLRDGKCGLHPPLESISLITTQRLQPGMILACHQPSTPMYLSTSETLGVNLSTSEVSRRCVHSLGTAR